MIYKKYPIRLGEVLSSNIQRLVTSSELLARILKEIWQSEGRVYVMGNGGSDATAQHMVIDFLSVRLNLDFPVYIEAITCNSPVITAIGNDIGFESIFAKQLEKKISERDLCIFISASGNSRNLIEACKTARKSGARTFGLLGFDGGKLLKEVDDHFLVETMDGEYGIVEDIHMSLVHATAEILRKPKEN